MRGSNVVRRREKNRISYCNHSVEYSFIYFFFSSFTFLLFLLAVSPHSPHSIMYLPWVLIYDMLIRQCAGGVSYQVREKIGKGSRATNTCTCTCSADFTSDVRVYPCKKGSYTHTHLLTYHTKVNLSHEKKASTPPSQDTLRPCPHAIPSGEVPCAVYSYLRYLCEKRKQKRVSCHPSPISCFPHASCHF